MSRVSEMLDRMPRSPIHTVVCADDSPFTVYIDGDTTAVPGMEMAGSNFSPGDRGYAIWSPPLPPHCYKVT